MARGHTFSKESVMTTPISSVRAHCKGKVLLFGFFVFTSGRLTGILSAQSMPGESGRFEVTSIRPSSAESVRPSIEFPPGGGVRAANITLKLLIQLAYNIRPEQLSGGPGWTDSEQYTVIAKRARWACSIGSRATGTDAQTPAGAPWRALSSGAQARGKPCRRICSDS